MKPIKQSTYETCLACCLLMLAGKGRRDEVEIWKHGWKFNYLIGQLNFVSSKYNKKIIVYIEIKDYFNWLQPQKSRGVKLVNSRIDWKLIAKLLKSQPVIIYADGYYPFVPNSAYVHAPHFIVALKAVGEFVEVVDTYDGKIKKWKINDLKKGITSLRNHLKYSPVLITID
ncbi:MAG: hypothetical protein WC517_03310 [Patescibacteria group bacterium]